jgi:hypothetical protein
MGPTVECDRRRSPGSGGASPYHFFLCEICGLSAFCFKRMVDLTRQLGIASNLTLQFVDSGKLLFRSKVLHKSDFNIFSIDLLIEIE